MRKISAQLRTLGSLTQDEIKDFVAWVTSIRNNFDPGVMSYPRTVMAQASADGDPYMMVPLHPVLVFESLAPRPGTSVLQIARGLQAISDATDRAGQACGFGEGYFITNSPEEVALSQPRGWKVVMHDPDRKMWLMKRILPRPDFPTP